MRIIPLVATLSFLAASAHAQMPPAKPEPEGSTLGFGLGATASCATWLRTPAYRAIGESWILGEWTGLNIFALPAGTGEVGHKTDSNGIIAEVEAVCRKFPSILLGLATEQVYGLMRDAHR